MHCLRHFYAKWCINRQKDGGLGLPPKNVQERLGHSTIAMTLDVYGHLFRADEAEELDAAETVADHGYTAVTCGLKAERNQRVHSRPRMCW